MCLAVVALDAHPRHAVVLAANRDELHARAALPAGWWPDGDVPLLAGRDLVGGGTWLGVDRRGRFAFVTNVRDPARHDPAAPTRGTLVPRVLRDPSPIDAAVARAVQDGAALNGFNLLAGDAHGAAWGSNRGQVSQRLAAGVHGVSNALLDTPWPKVVRTRERLCAWLATGDDDLAPLFDLLADRAMAPDDELPDTGVGVARERLLSAPFIADATYGTRCSTVVTIGRDGRVRFVERSFDAAGRAVGEVDVAFDVDRALSAVRAA
jgi:uncharacterized protein with NRDE domain